MDLDGGLKKAIATYECGEQEGPFLVARSVPWVAYDSWMCCLECCWRLEYRGGDVWMHGDPSVVHETVSNWFNSYIITQIQLIPEVECAIDVITGARASRLRTIKGDKEPDQCYSGSSLGSVIEVAYRNEALESLRDTVLMWEASGCLLALGVKITDELNLTFLVKEHGASLQEIEFGPQVCCERNRDSFVHEFPVSYFTGDIKGQYKIKFDLFRLQQYIIKMMEYERQVK